MARMTTTPARDGFPVTRAPEGVMRFRRNADGRFVNLDGSGPQGIAAVYKWVVRDKLAGRRRKSPPSAPVPALDVDPVAIQVPPGPGEPPRIVWLGRDRARARRRVARIAAVGEVISLER